MSPLFSKNCALKVAFTAFLCLYFVPTSLSYATLDLKEWLKAYSEDDKKLIHKQMVASWNYKTDLTDEHQHTMLETSFNLSEFRRTKAIEAKDKFGKETIKDKNLKRAYDVVEDVGISISSDKKKLQEISSLASSMLKVYSTACFNVDGECKKLQPHGLARIIAKDRHYNKLKEVWKGWRDVSGKKMRKDFAKWVKLSNEAIKEGPHHDLGESWLSTYGPGFVENVEHLLDEIKPLYELFHAYARNKLSDHYGAEHFKDNLIPAHLLGNMWAQDWANIDDILLPFADKMDVTGEMIKQNYTVRKMFHKAENFFTSIGLKPMTDIFWNKTIYEKIPDKDMVCHASAWDLMEKNDFRIKMCTEITMEDFVTIHHEMGHIQYYQQYENQPVYFRNGANPGFHEAVGDTLALSVSTPEHLKKINLVKTVPGTKEFEINYLMQIAMDKLVFYPFAYIMDKFRWNVFNGKISENEYTAKWWEYKCKYQGIKPPVKRTEDDFDPGAKMHMAGAIPYIRYFVSYVIQFQFHKALCDKIGHKGPLHKCDIYNHKEAGDALSEMLQLGSSVPWEDALEKLTGNRKMDAGPMIEYFRPLSDWLKETYPDLHAGWDCTGGAITTPKPHSSAPRTSDSLKTFFLLCVLFVSVFMNVQ